MKAQKKEWFYFKGEEQEWTREPVTRDELDALFRDGKIEHSTQVISRFIIERRGPKAHGMAYSSLAKVDIEFTPPVEELFAARAGKPVTILSGANNCGKTLLLKNLFALAGQGTYL